MTELKKAVSQAVELFLSNGWQITNTENKCILLRVQSTTVENLIKLCRDCISGEINNLLHPVENAIRKMQDYERVSLETVICEEEFWRLASMTISVIADHMKAGESKTRAPISMPDAQPESNTQGGTKLYLRLHHQSSTEEDKLIEAFKTGEVKRRMKSIKDAVEGDYENLKIKAILKSTDNINPEVRVNELPLTLELESASTYCRHHTGKDNGLRKGSASAFESRTKYINVDSDDWILFTIGLHYVESLECYTCSNISNVIECASTSRCQNDQSCFLNVSSNGNRLGCINNQECGGLPNVASLIGRSPNLNQHSTDYIHRQDLLSAHESTERDLRAINSERDIDYCFECCSSDICNINLCKHLKPTACIDDPKVDCALMNSKFRICQNIHEAKTVCPKFCGLCSLVDGSWGGWSSWSICDVTCGNGTQTRTRQCNNPTPVYGGLNCSGSDMEHKACILPTCPVDGNWEDWSSWSSCDVTCGNGTNTRTRACTNPAPAYSGRNCSGKSAESKTCVNDNCPVDGGWTPWLPWEACSVICDIGIQRRHRTCSNPVPQHYGHYCLGDTMDVSLCLPGPCSNGGWSTWEAWSTCSVTCGSGIKSRSRTCNNPRPSALGRQCEGDPVQDISCNNDACVTPTIVFVAHNPQSLNLYTNGIFVFTTVTLNIGNGYNSSTGIFTAPLAGTYSFSTQICIERTSIHFTRFNIVQNGKPIASSIVHGNNVDVACYNSDVTAILRLQDRVWIEHQNGGGSAYESPDIWSMFSGTLQHI